MKLLFSIKPGILWLIILLSQSQSGICQKKQIYFENYNSEQGLSQNSCYTIAQDAEGFMWFGTQDGLNRYDGREFKVYLPQTKEGSQLSANHITSLYFDSITKLLWIGTIKGACYYRSQYGQPQKLSKQFSFAATLENIPIKKIHSFTPGQYWFITFNKGLFFVDINRQVIDSFFQETESRSRVNSISFHEGKLVSAVNNRLYQLSPAEKNFSISALPLLQLPEVLSLYSYEDTLWAGSANNGCYKIADVFTGKPVLSKFEVGAAGVGSFTLDPDGSLWIGTRGEGIIKYKPKTGESTQILHDEFDNRTPGKDFVLSLFTDRQGIIWTGLSGSGLAKHDPLRFQFSYISHKAMQKNSLPDNMVFDVFKTKAGKYFVGTQTKGLAEWNPSDNTFYTYEGSSRVRNAINTIYDITEDEAGTLWVASWGGLMKLKTGSQQIEFVQNDSLITATKMYGLIKLKNADSLFITGENGPVFYDIKENKWRRSPENPMEYNNSVGRFIYEDKNHILWICTIGAGLIRYDYRQGKFKIIDAVKNITTYVRHILADQDLFWLATDHGIIVYDPQKDSVIRHIVPLQLKNSQVCYATQKDAFGNYWVSTNSGLVKINGKNFSLRKYNESNGLSYLEFNTACTWKAPNGQLLFGGVGGITVFNPRDIKENEFSPAPIISSLRIFDSTRTFGLPALTKGDIDLKHKQNFITLHFAVNNFSGQENNVFSYRLRGLNEHWSVPAEKNFAEYTGLPPGEYVFELKAANSDGKWSDIVSVLKINIHPPWWATWYFKTLVTFLLLGAATFFVIRRIKNIKRSADLKQKILETEMMTLRAQMNPHFVFNSLNSIREMILNNNNEEASRYLGKFAQLIRITLKQTSKPFVTLRETTDYLKRYAEMEKIRTSEFTFDVYTDDDLDPDEVLVPPMLIQPFVENSIWHGSDERKNAIHVQVNFLKEQDQLLCTIEDNGIGINTSKKNKNGSSRHDSIGILNVEERIKLLNEKYNTQSLLQIEDKSTIKNDDQGTLVQIYLPLQSDSI